LVSDRFPEAFRRFEKQVSFRNIKNFRQLTLVFESWAGQKWVPTYRQMNALADEAQRRGIPVYIERERRVFRSNWISQPTWRYETVTVKGKSQQRYRDIKTGRFVKKP
jgi:hypothetical protein